MPAMFGIQKYESLDGKTMVSYYYQSKKSKFPEVELTLGSDGHGRLYLPCLLVECREGCFCLRFGTKTFRLG